MNTGRDQSCGSTSGARAKSRPLDDSDPRDPRLAAGDGDRQSHDPASDDEDVGCAIQLGWHAGIERAPLSSVQLLRPWRLEHRVMVGVQQRTAAPAGRVAAGRSVVDPEEADIRNIFSKLELEDAPADNRRVRSVLAFLQG